MNDLRQIFYCASINFRKWFTKPKYFIIAILALLVNIDCFAGYTFYCVKSGSVMAPWILSMLTTGNISTLAFSFLAILLFCDAPFLDADTAFVLIRTGKRNWVLGQLLYIFITSLIFVLFYYLTALLVVSPVLGYASDWGAVIRLAGTNLSMIIQYDLPWLPRAGVTDWILDTFTPLRAEPLSLLLLWLSTVFAGVLVFAGNLLVAPGFGSALTGVFAVFSSFIVGGGIFVLGPWKYHTAPMLWGMLAAYSDSGMPPFSYTIPALIFAIVLLSSFSVGAFCKRDLDIQKGLKK